MKRTMVAVLIAACSSIAVWNSIGAAEPVIGKSVLQSARELETAYIQTIKNVLPAYVFLDGGSGVLISADGYFLTNHHVIRNKKSTLVRNGGKDYEAKTIGIDTKGDIALLKMDGVTTMPFLKFADSDTLHVGQQVFAIGNPFNTAEVTDDPTVTTGIISALHRYENNYTDAIQTDAAVNPGNSGGPLVTLDGKLAGINGLIETKFGNAANTGIALAIPAKQIERFLPKLKLAGGKTVHHGTIAGLNSDSSSSAEVEDEEGIRNGALVKFVAPGSPAEKLGLKVGDKIVKIDSYPLLNLYRFKGVINTYPAGSDITLTYERGGATKNVVATLEKPMPGILGVEMKSPLTIRDEKFAVPIIAKVEPNSAASKAGLKPGDVITAINGYPMETLPEVRKFMRTVGMSAYDLMKFKVQRGPDEKPEELELTATLTAGPEMAKAK